ncbi:C-type lectin domain family 17, member A [Oryzias melastigma]|uniref:C-type lectin domain family 17, member A n=1 Tax=Oryzias melastigma TaxID=30732 RepID=UPI00168D6D54|nr:C-type lectin domain family 17, member A [Oryzias melastigma]
MNIHLKAPKVDFACHRPFKSFLPGFISDGDTVRNRKDNLIVHLNAVIERLNSSLTETTKELMECKQRKTECPAEWKSFDSSCYFLSGESKSWDEARRFCRAREADLVVINNRDENAFLLAFTKRSVWIGLSDEASEGTWKWVDGSPLTLKFWKHNQPDNGAGIAIYGEEDCAQLTFEDSGSWNDISCKTSLPWICEKKAK